MSLYSDDRSFEMLASDVAAMCADAIDNDRLDDIDDESLGQLIGTAIRVYAEKAQRGLARRPTGRNSGVTVTDVAISCTALMQSVGLEVFELGAWQSMSSIGRYDER